MKYTKQDIIELFKLKTFLTEEEQLSEAEYLYNKLIAIVPTTYKVVAYGSLIDDTSRATSVKSASNLAPVVIEGLARVFNIKSNLYGGTLLNVMYDSRATLDAYCFECSYEDFVELSIREYQYDMTNVTSTTGESMWVSIGRESKLYTELPSETYLQKVAHIYYNVSEKAYNSFVDTTRVNHIANRMRLGDLCDISTKYKNLLELAKTSDVEYKSTI